MKKFTFVLTTLVATAFTTHAQLFVQDFSAGGTTPTYVNATTPTTGQWNAISTTGAAKTWAISSNTLSLSSTGANSAYASRTTDFSLTPTLAQLTFSFTLSGASTALTSAFQMSLGSGFGTANSQETNANTYAKFGLNFTATDGFVVRDISGTTNGASTFGLGTYNFTWVLNNSGSSTSYLAPDGSTETIANDTWDLWVGNSKQLNDRAVTTASQSITDWKFGADTNGTYALAMDNFSIQSIPEPSTYALIGMGVLGLVLARRFRVKKA